MLILSGKYLKKLEAERGASFAEEIDAWEAVCNLERLKALESGIEPITHQNRLI